MLKRFIIEMFTNDGIAFSKNEEGEDIFYPWGYPGEALLLNSKIKKPFLIAFYSGILSFGLANFVSFIAFDDLNDTAIALVSFLKIGTRLSAG